MKCGAFSRLWYWYVLYIKNRADARSTPTIPSFCYSDMDSSRAASISRSLLAQEALALVSAQHPRGLASFAVDAHVANRELSAALTASFRGLRLAYRLARPYKGCTPNRLLLAEYKSLFATHLVLWSLSADATDRLSVFTRGMDPQAFAAFELDVKFHQKSAR